MADLDALWTALRRERDRFPLEVKRCEDVAGDCRRVALSAGDQQLAAAASALQAHTLAKCGDLAAAARVQERAEREHLESPLLETSAALAMGRGHIAFQSGDYTQALASAERGVKLADRTNYLGMRLNTRRIAVLANSLDVRRVKPIVSEIHALAAEAGDPVLTGPVYNDVAMMHFRLGEFREAEAVADRGLDFYSRQPEVRPDELGILVGTRGEIRTADGRPAEALPDLDRALELMPERESNFRVIADTVCARIEALLALEDNESAADVGRELLKRLGSRLPHIRRRVMTLTAEALKAAEPHAAYELLTGAFELYRQESEHLRNHAREQAEIDSLTGTHNRRFLDNEFSILDAEQAAVGLVFIDVDHFKQINDEFGHHVGDEVLADLADILRASVKDVGRVIRTGGDEFLLLFERQDAGHAERTAEAAHRRIRAHDWNSIREGLKVTVSAGAVGTSSCEDTSKLLRLADRRLVSAKQAGRNRTDTTSAGQVGLAA
ncbi:MAG: GGDEF domain-containing protein [Solirubrobacterales bacterium]|nr:GGDEF domain-containing protein [Solirubrobacterales bacterium]